MIFLLTSQNPGIVALLWNEMYGESFCEIRKPINKWNNCIAVYDGVQMKRLLKPRRIELEIRLQQMLKSIPFYNWCAGFCICIWLCLTKLLISGSLPCKYATTLKTEIHILTCIVVVKQCKNKTKVIWSKLCRCDDVCYFWSVTFDNHAELLRHCVILRTQFFGPAAFLLPNPPVKI